MKFFGRRKTSQQSQGSFTTTATDGPNPNLSKAQLHRATHTRKTFTVLTSLFLFISVIFLVLLEVGGTFNRSVIKNWYFIKLDLSHIIPASVPNFALINTIAQTLGLHDFYQVALWGFCEGYNGQGVTYCSHPQTLYWFNPVKILASELLSGASINLPADVNKILRLIKLASQIMSGFFLTGACLSTILIFIGPLSVFSRWFTLFIALLFFINALLVTAASIIATVMFVIFRNVIGSVEQLNIKASLGNTMFAFMWIASAFTIFAWLIQTGLCCCCASRRDVKTGRKRGNEKAYATTGATNGVTDGANGTNGTTEKPQTRKRFRLGKKSV